MNKETYDNFIRRKAIENLLPVRIGDPVYWVSEDTVRERHGGNRFQIESYNVKAIRVEWADGDIAIYVSDGYAFNLYGGEYAIPELEDAEKRLGFFQDIASHE